MLKPNAPGIKGDLHARLERIDSGMFRAVFAGELNPENAAAGQEWPDAHIGDTPEGVRGWVESMAPQLGYRRVIWDS
ncbi:MAG TPA: hypothetical protein VLI93_05525 [Acetobacteraceae bacterium]|nr:hypothetical protein [Acetobacteraceae bacterium]